MELQEDQTNDQPGDDTGHSNVDDFGGVGFLEDHGSLGEDAGLGQGNATEFNFFCALLDAIIAIDLDRLLEMQGHSSTSLKKSPCKPFLDMLYPPLVEHELILCIHSTYPYLTEDAILARLPMITDYLFQDPKFQNCTEINQTDPVRQTGCRYMGCSRGSGGSRQ